MITTCREVWFDFVAISALSMSSDSAYGSTDRPCAVLSATQGAEWPHCVLLLIVIGKELPAQTLQYCKGSHVSGLSSLEIAHTADPAPAAKRPESLVCSQAQACPSYECPAGGFGGAAQEAQHMSCTPEQPSTPAPQQQ